MKNIHFSMQINTLTLAGRNGSCACLPAGLENAVIIAGTLAVLQNLAGPDGFAALTFLGSPYVYHTAKNLNEVQRMRLHLHLKLLRLLQQLRGNSPQRP